MRVVIQRVKNASVEVDNQIVGSIQSGLLVLLGIEDADHFEDIDWLTSKIVSLRIFNDKDDVMNLSVLDVDGQILLVSQFTLFAQTKKGNRPSYIRSSKPEFAISMYNQFHQLLESKLNKKVPTGIFGAHMNVDLLNDGPVTICIDSKNRE